MENRRSTLTAVKQDNPPLHGQVEAGICIPGQSYKVYVLSLSLSVLTAIIPSEPGLASFIEAKDLEL